MRKHFMKMVLLTVFAALPFAAFAGAELPKPLPNTFIHDFAGVIQNDKKAEIQAKAQQLKDKYKTEIAIVTIDSLEGEDSFDYSVRMARAWGIGSKDDEVRGLLILVAVKDRKTAFRTSRHIEGELPDGVTGDINRQMGAYFKDGDFGGGLSLGMSKILERLEKVYESPQTSQPQKDKSYIWLWILLGCAGIGGFALLLIWRARQRAAEVERKRALTVAETRRNYFAQEKSSRQTGQMSKQEKEERRRRKEEKKRLQKLEKASRRPAPYVPSSNSYDSSSSYSSSDYSSSSSSYESSSSYDSGSSSSYDSGSSSSSDSGSSYGGGSDFGGGGSDSSW
jgi:uncharacterized protein